MTSPAIHLHRVSKTFPGNAAKALDAVSLTVLPGEMVALIGASGSGKSTLMRHLAGLARADRDSGAIRINGGIVQEGGRLARDIRARRAQIGLVFQQFNLVGRLPVMTNVLAGALGRVPFWRSLLRWFTHAERQEAAEALARVGILPHAARRASTLSGGQQQRAAIARTLMQKARTILADEPIASLDPESARRVMETLATVNRDDGITVIVSLHQVDFARRFCPRTIALKNGAVVFDGPSVALTSDRLGDLYGADSELMAQEAALPPMRAPATRTRPALGLRAEAEA